jgi:hypothetical protein
MVFRHLPCSFVVPAWEDMDTPVHDLARDVPFKTLTKKELDTLKKKDAKAYREYKKRYDAEYEKALWRDLEKQHDVNGITRSMNSLKDALRSQKNHLSKHVASSQDVRACLSCGRLCMP